MRSNFRSGLWAALLGAGCAVVAFSAQGSPMGEAETSLLAQLTIAQGARDQMALVGRPAFAGPIAAGRPGPSLRAQRAFEPLAEAAANRHGVSIDFFKRLIRQESGYNPNAISIAGAQGLAQIMPATAAQLGLDDPFDPAKALPISAEHIADLQRRLGNEGLAAAAYNAGEGRVRAWLAGRSGLPLETQNYVRLITGRNAHEWAPAGTPPMTTSGYASLRSAASARLPTFTRSQSAEWQFGIKLLGKQNQLASLLEGPGAAPTRRNAGVHVPRGASTPTVTTGERALCASMGSGCIVAKVY